MKILLLLFVVAVVIAALWYWLAQAGRAVAAFTEEACTCECDDCLRQLDLERASNAQLLTERDDLLARATRAEERFNELFMEYQEDAAFRREMEQWHRGIDPHLVSMTPAQIDKLWEAIWHPVTPSPASYSTVAELLGGGGGEVSEDV